MADGPGRRAACASRSPAEAVHRVEIAQADRTQGRFAEDVAPQVHPGAAGDGSPQHRAWRPLAKQAATRVHVSEVISKAIGQAAVEEAPKTPLCQQSAEARLRAATGLPE
jgi:hypothetical protein